MLLAEKPFVFPPIQLLNEYNAPNPLQTQVRPTSTLNRHIPPFAPFSARPPKRQPTNLPGHTVLSALKNQHRHRQRNIPGPQKRPLHTKSPEGLFPEKNRQTRMSRTRQGHRPHPIPWMLLPLVVLTCFQHFDWTNPQVSAPACTPRDAPPGPKPLPEFGTRTALSRRRTVYRPRPSRK